VSIGLLSPERQEKYRQRNGYELTYAECRKQGHAADDWGDCPRCGAVPSMDDRMVDMVESGDLVLDSADAD
jgi:hypothetical protein